MRNQTQPEASLDPDIATLVHKLRERLTAGKALPAERAIADEYAVKRHRVRQALACLREQGDLDSTRRISATGGELREHYRRVTRRARHVVERLFYGK